MTRSTSIFSVVIVNAKSVAAGALLIAACGSLVVGCGSPNDSSDVALPPVSTGPAIAPGADGVFEVSATTSLATESSTTYANDSVADDHFTLVIDSNIVTLSLPHDAQPDAINVLRPGAPVLGVERWMTECCWLSLVVQNQRPRFEDSALAETFGGVGLDWDLYSIEREDFAASEAVAATDAIAISISAQVRFPGEAPVERAAELVRAVAQTVRLETE